jgi:hypothetical protein
VDGKLVRYSKKSGEIIKWWVTILDWRKNIRKKW